MDYLQQWFKQFDSYKMLNIKEAQELTLKLTESTDIEEKKKIEEEIIFGTMHIIYKYLLKNKIYLLKSSTYDIEDIISTFCEEWISYIKNYRLLEIKHYSEIFNKLFISTISKKIIGNTINIREIYNLSTSEIVNELLNYIECMNLEIEPKKSILNYLCYTIYNQLDDQLTFSSSKLEMFIQLLLEIGLFDILDENEIIVDYILNVEERIDSDKSIKKIKNYCLSNRDFYIISERFGLYDEMLTLKELSQELHKAKESIRRVEKNSVNKIRRYLT